MLIVKKQNQVFLFNLLKQVNSCHDLLKLVLFYNILLQTVFGTVYFLPVLFVTQLQRHPLLSTLASLLEDLHLALCHSQPTRVPLRLVHRNKQPLFSYNK